VFGFDRCNPIRCHIVPLKRGRLSSINGDEYLRCPQFRNAGIASLSQFKDASMPSVDSVRDGFKAVQTEYGPDFRCGTCNVRVLP
jgi:hypothetical protein